MTAVTPPPFEAQQRPPRPSHELSSREDICFLHPGYQTLNLLLTLPRVDCATVADATPTYGVHHRTALLACQIIAGNTFNNSRFALDRAGRQPVQVLLDSVLTDAEYFFIVDSSDLYPIVPSFQDWQFPHGRIPDFWPPPTTASLTTTCGITNTTWAIDKAHIIPLKERVWFEDNNMSRYGRDIPDIDNEANILPLRKDIHYCFDHRYFVIVPKVIKVKAGSVAPSTQYVTHIISQDATELWPAQHNILIESHHGNSRAYLFARFAWAILLRVKVFVIKGCPRHVIRIRKDDEGKIAYEAEHCAGTILQSAYGGGGSQAANSKKRKSAQDSTTNDEENSLESSCGDSSISTIDEADRWYLIEDWNERGKRGRRERQESSDETAPDTKVHLALDDEADLKEALQGHTEQ